MPKQRKKTKRDNIQLKIRAEIHNSQKANTSTGKSKIITRSIFVLLVADVLVLLLTLYFSGDTPFQGLRNRITLLETQFSSKINNTGESTIVVLDNPDGSSYFDPNIIQLRDGTYRMYVSDRLDGNIICFDSTDAKTWSKKQVSLEHGEKGAWDETVNRGTVNVVDGRYVMYFTGQCNGESRIGIATSEDGVRFEKWNVSPALSPNSEIYPWEKFSVMNPYVLYMDDVGLYYMYYAAGETYEPDVIALATSTDGYAWEKTGKIMLEKSNGWNADCDRVGACEVYQRKDGYIMYYIGYTDIDTARICYAKSRNSIDWRKPFFRTVVTPSNEYNQCACYKPTVLTDATGRLRLWYNGRSGADERICVVDLRTH